jgi:hypothetical protein
MATQNKKSNKSERGRAGRRTHILVLIDSLFLTNLEPLGLLREHIMVLGRGGHLGS